MRVPLGTTRRGFLALGAAALASPLLSRKAFAALPTDTPLHGMSAFGELRYPAGFSHFDYASPDAPKGGAFNFSPFYWYFNQSPLTFNTLNSYALRGEAPPRMEMCFSSLMVSALDEPDAIYGELAESVTVTPDRNSFLFRIRPEARFHDGTPIRPSDVAYSFKLLKEKGHPQLMLPLRRMAAAESDGDTFRLVLDGKQSSRLILQLAGFPVFSEADIAANGFERAATKPLLGSGPYKVGRVAAGQSIEYERVADFWGRDLAVNRGLYHFDRIRIEFYGDRQAAFEAFKKGAIKYREEATSRIWATGYDFPALQEKRVVKREFSAELRPVMQAWALNQRRAPFKDIRVRQAIALCFDFEWTNRNLFFDAYARSQSPFERSDFKAEGAPSPEELALLEPWRSKVPDTTFGEAVIQPISNGSGRDRRLLGQAAKLLKEAGWERDGALIRKSGGTLALEIMVEDDSLARVMGPFVENLRAVGVDARMRQVDSTQYEKRQRSFDFDMVMAAGSFTATPTRDELLDSFHSDTADSEGSRNLPGTADPAVDALIDAAGAAETRAELAVALRALDRVLRARLDWIPNWFSANHKSAYWDAFGFKEPKPDYGFPVEALWWWDKAKAQAIGL